MILTLIIIICFCFAVIFAMFGISGLTQSLKKKPSVGQASNNIDKHPSALS